MVSILDLIYRDLPQIQSIPLKSITKEFSHALQRHSVKFTHKNISQNEIERADLSQK